MKKLKVGDRVRFDIQFEWGDTPEPDPGSYFYINDIERVSKSAEESEKLVWDPAEWQKKKDRFKAVGIELLRLTAGRKAYIISANPGKRGEGGILVTRDILRFYDNFFRQKAAGKIPAVT